ncbi:glycosyl hydrolase 115 family protein [Cellulosilyticum sp. I15G10I2]|uniref:glycosyl hydrolase 115 family protein n=1 Tax=Cellulosilyticum sp. I15G10I2 TaxID=1892843 RepID=UPI000AC5F4F7|nr:glycosyl hydrolase 115 family protein [Cellulosilyticum sp. I15G10I2]
MMGLVFNKNIKIVSEVSVEPVQWALKNLQRDIHKACFPSTRKGCQLFLEEKPSLTKECFSLVADPKNNRLCLYAGDELGFVYGLYEISRSILGITDFWFWNDQEIRQREEYPVSGQYRFDSKPYAVTFRGWFVNDEVLIRTWRINRRKDEPWEMVFEALLRCGGNMVIPGTDKNSEGYRGLASAMGLYVTHHHAEPLGAQMFARAYPDLTPSYRLYPDKFQELWQQGIQDQKELKVIWNIGFRGQGDRPFWDDDPKYQTQESRGELISHLIRMQYNMVKKELPDAVCCTNLYGEVMELYRGGYLDLPEDVIKIWADNGFGKMVTRCQENHNPRIPALPSGEEGRGSHGIYYHVSFYDLQAANHITMLQNSPEFVCRELQDVMKHGVKDYWLVNCSNIKPHVYFLDLLAKIWRNGTVDIEEHRRSYVTTYYGKKNESIISACLADYPKYAISYGPNEDDHAGEQFATHVGRMLISQYMKQKEVRSEHLLWATDSEDLRGQVQWYQKLCRTGEQNYKEYLRKCEKVNVEIIEEKPGVSGTRRLFEDSLLLQVQIQYHCYAGAYMVCQSLMEAMDGQYQKSFYYAGKAREEYLTANTIMRSREHGKWHNFYENECLADIKQSAWLLEGLMSYVRNLGDGPHFYEWQRDFLYSEEDRRVMLILVMENHLKDQEIFALMKEKWD